MKKTILILGAVALILTSCSVTKKIVAYPKMYEIKPVTILLMPPINRSTNVEAKEFFHSTLNVPLAEAGYYVIPPFMSMEILKKESAYDSELFIDGSLSKFGEVFGADMVLFTVIHKWEKSGLAAMVNVKVEYIIRSAKTNEVLYTRIADVIYDTSVSTGVGGIWGMVADMTLSAVNTAATKYVDVARTCNAFTIRDIPAGKYSPLFGLDGEKGAGKKEFRVSLSSKYR
jgi:hypothetical protein